MLEYIVCEYGPDIILGMPEGQKIKMRKYRFENITIMEEDNPKGTQKLKTEDIIEELNKIPKNFRKYVSSIVLNPFYHQYHPQDFATPMYKSRQITIWADERAKKDILE